MRIMPGLVIVGVIAGTGAWAQETPSPALLGKQRSPAGPVVTARPVKLGPNLLDGRTDRSGAENTY